MPHTLKSDNPIKSYSRSLHIWDRWVGGGLNPSLLQFLSECFPLGLKLFYMTCTPSNWFSNSNFLRRFETIGANNIHLYLITAPHFCEKCKIFGTIDGLCETHNIC